MATDTCKTQNTDKILNNSIILTSLKVIFILYIIGFKISYTDA